MSYLAALRLHFAGQFQAAPSTVNNDPQHFNNDTFKPTDKLPSLPPPGDPRGWWNPRGNADWRFIGCRVTGASYGDGTRAPAGDPVLGMVVADSDRRVPAKMADLDTEQQLVSEIWGLEVRICAGDGTTVVRGEFAPAPFIDIWDRAQGPGGGGDIGACAAYQSVVGALEWGDLGGSRMLGELREAAGAGLLSMRFNVDGYNMTLGAPDFTRGRIAGTIGVASATEPKHFVAGRQFMARAASGGNFFKPTGSINFCTGVVDEALGRVFVDLGNALPTVGPGGPQEDLGELTLGYVAPGDSKLTPLGVIDYRGDAWYAQSAGVVEVAVDGAQVAAIREAELGLSLSSVPAVTFESPGGVYVKADDFVHRLDPGEAAEVAVFATRYGRPYAGAEIVAVEDPSGLQIQVAPGDPDPGTPGSAISFAATLEPAGADGRATLRIEASDPGNPRAFIDGAGLRGAAEPGRTGVRLSDGPVELRQRAGLRRVQGGRPDHMVGGCAAGLPAVLEPLSGDGQLPRPFGLRVGVCEPRPPGAGVRSRAGEPELDAGDTGPGAVQAGGDPPVDGQPGR